MSYSQHFLHLPKRSWNITIPGCISVAYAGSMAWAVRPTLGDLLTNAKKVTVSVLYWYEKLSSLLTEIFKMIRKRIKTLLFFWALEGPLVNEIP